MVKTGFKQITQGLLSETFVEAHVCVSFFVCLSVCLHLFISASIPLSVYLCPACQDINIQDGIITTLNTRVSILAAANPLYRDLTVRGSHDNH